MEKIFSKLKPEVLLNIVYRAKDLEAQISPGFDITPESEFIQVRSLKAQKGKEYRAHKHNIQKRETLKTQESIIVLSGSLNVKLYDLDDSFLGEVSIGKGDCFITLSGGHAFYVLEDNTTFYELKNGPYNGLENDKTFLDGNKK